MNNDKSHVAPDETIAAAVAAAMTNESVVSASRLTTGEQNFVFSVKTTISEYVIRMTYMQYKDKFSSALYWQNKLIPLGVPLARFIHTDLDARHSSFASVLMHKLPGDDLINIYSQLSDTQKMNLAHEIVTIQHSVNSLPEGRGFGFVGRYEDEPAFHSWYDFMLSRIEIAMNKIKDMGVFDVNSLSVIYSIAKELETDLRAVHAKPFMWDTSERNVIINQGKISGIVDVDDMCFGDSLFVLALTYVALELFGHDTVYTDYWADLLKLDANARLRLTFYRLCYILWFMRKYNLTSHNQQAIIFDAQRLNDMFKKLL